MGVRAKLFAALYDRMMAAAEEAGLAAHREALLGRCAGRVIEIGGGTGANLSFYPRSVTELVIAEPEDAMARRLERKLHGYPIPTQVVRAPAERLPLRQASFDCAVATLVLCTVPDPAGALAEIRRLLKPAGRLLFLEHVRADDPALARWQDRLRRPWAFFGCGCQCNRRTVESIRGAGFTVADLRREQFPKAAALVRPLAIGTALPG
ncbi:MAG TPA: class I SAM-dependent methyltransferase [Myxococcales bacterium]